MMPFVFRSLLGSISLPNIPFSCGANLGLQEGVRVTFAGTTVLRGAFIAILAYTYWLEKSRDKLSAPCPFSCR